MYRQKFKFNIGSAPRKPTVFLLLTNKFNLIRLTSPQPKTLTPCQSTSGSISSVITTRSTRKQHPTAYKFPDLPDLAPILSSRRIFATACTMPLSAGTGRKRSRSSIGMYSGRRSSGSEGPLMIFILITTRR